MKPKAQRYHRKWMIAASAATQGKMARHPMRAPSVVLPCDHYPDEQGRRCENCERRLTADDIHGIAIRMGIPDEGKGRRELTTLIRSKESP